MTRDWIEHRLSERGNTWETVVGGLERVCGTYETVRLVGTAPNRTMAIIERISDGKREFAHVRDLGVYPIHYLETFDCLRVEGRLEWAAKPNEAVY